ncbi:hypothetical protein BH11MYX4_BH11MYX4_52300 [soil metagenome]
MRWSLSLVVPVVAFVLAACSSSAPPPAPSAEHVATAASPIINGNLDTTHQAVVALILQQGNDGGLCSGSIVKVDTTRHIGWVLTAAHCVEIPPVYVLQGNDYAASGILRYDVIDYFADPGYSGSAGSPSDFAVVRIAGVDGTTPILPMVGAADGLATGTPVVSVGYGRTTLNSSGATDMNTVRRNVSKTLSQVGQAQIAFNMTQSGICQGDSGGPVIVSSGGVEKVAGVHSYVQGDCNGQGVSGRVSFALGWINDQIAKALPAEDCDLCEKIANSGNSVCAALSRSCLADKQCNGYYECISAGGSKASCVAKFPKAEGPFNAAANCTCTTACASTCGTGIACKNAPKCGFKLPAGACATCSEGACCDETLACASDGECYVCLKGGDKDPGCATNAARKKMATCVATKCSTECAGSGLDTGADPVVPEEDAGPAAAPGGSTTTTTSGCSVAHSRVPGGSAYGLAALAGLVVTLARRRRR